MQRRIVTLYLQAEEYEFLRRYAYERRKSMSAVLKECLVRLEATTKREPGLWRKLGEDVGTLEESRPDGAEVVQDAPRPYVSALDEQGVNHGSLANLRQVLIKELVSASDSFLRSGFFATLAQTVGIGAGTPDFQSAFTEPLSQEIVREREELRRS